MQSLEPHHDEVVVGPSDRNFGFTMAVVFALIGAFGLYKASSHAPIWLTIAAVFALVTLWRPQSQNTQGSLERIASTRIAGESILPNTE